MWRECVRLESPVTNSRTWKFYVTWDLRRKTLCHKLPCRGCRHRLAACQRLHPCKVIACCVAKCFSILEVFPPFDVIKALHVLQLALVLSFLVKYNQTLERFCLNAMLETF